MGTINIESSEEIEDIERLYRVSGATCRVGLRANLGIEAETHAKLATGSFSHKFGMPEKEILKVCSKASNFEHVRIVGIHSHVGSQITEVQPFKRQAEYMVKLASRLKAYGVEVQEINFGGGLGFHYQPDQRTEGYKEYAEATAGTVRKKVAELGLKQPRIVYEPGRAIVADTTILITRVNYVKKMGRARWILVDAGMNDLLRPALYGAYHEVVPADKAPFVPRRRGRFVYNIGGPVCESADIFAEGRSFDRKVKKGDLLAILDVGAYGISMASQYNMRPRAAMVMVYGGSSYLVRRREANEELFVHDILPEFFT